MEFFSIADVATTGEQLQRALDIASLPKYCASIEQVLSDAGEAGEIYCLWGTYAVNREPIRAGVRFTLPGCPNAVAWTVTTGFPPAPDAVVVHLTINRTEHAADFIESIETFIADWKRGLETSFPRQDVRATV